MKSARIHVSFVCFAISVAAMAPPAEAKKHKVLSPTPRGTVPIATPASRPWANSWWSRPKSDSFVYKLQDHLGINKKNRVQSLKHRQRQDADEFVHGRVDTAGPSIASDANSVTARLEELGRKLKNPSTNERFKQSRSNSETPQRRASKASKTEKGKEPLGQRPPRLYGDGH